MSEQYINQTLNIGSIRRFLTRRESVLLFLALTGVMAVLLVVFGQPTSLTSYCEQLSRLTLLGQIAICFTSGYGILILSHILLSLVGGRRVFPPALYVLWLVGEMIIIVTVMTLVLWAVSGAGKVDLASLVGSLELGFIGILIVPYVVTFLIYRLHETHDEVRRLRLMVENKDSSQQQAADRTINFYVKGGRLAFSTRLNNILFIEAADNYVNIHYLNEEKEETFILFNSMKNIEKSFAGSSLMRCHRGYMVNVENVRLMRKESMGLVLELAHTAKVIPVSKSFADSITRYFAYNTDVSLPGE